MRASSASSHLLQAGEDTCEGLPTTVCSEHRQNSPTRSRVGARALFLRAAREPSVGKWPPQQIKLKVFQTGFITCIDTREIRPSKSLNKKRCQMLALCWCSLDEGREVVMVMKMTMTTAVTSLTQHGLWSHTCLFTEVLFEVPGTALSLDSTKL